ncbi:hypothetical protein HX744_26065 [Pseudonocardia sp. ICBG1122]|nr:hypothetical protein [Pseudonocardia pini]
MAGNQTAYTAENVRSTSQEHDQLADTLDQEMNRLQGEIQQTLAASSSSMTHALDSTYEEFRAEMKKAVVDNMHAMANDMRTALSGQEGANDSATSGVRSAGGAMGGFLAPTG